jgi:hypothetical protein
MVGVWLDEEYGWGIKFESDGTIRKIKHMTAGESELKEGGIYIKGTEEGTHAFFVYGDCELTYNKSKDIIDVIIIVNDFEMQFADDEKLTGRIEDYFTGSVSDDGQIWKVKWRSYLYPEGGDAPDKKLTEENPIPLTFHKLDLSK